VEIRPILSSMRKNRVGVILIAIQIAVTFAVVLNCLNLAREEMRKLEHPTGMDVANMVVVTADHYDGKLSDERFEKDTIQRDLTWLRAQDGVIGAGNLLNFPLSGSGSSDTREPEGAPERSADFCWYLGDQQVLETYGLELVEGRVFTEEEVRSEASVSLITKALADALFPDGNALGQVLHSDRGPQERVIGIIDHMQGSWRNWSNFDKNAFYPRHSSFLSGKIHYMVRVTPGSVDRFIPFIEEHMGALYPDRLLAARPFQEIKDRHFRDSYATSRIMIGISIVLILVTALGIMGLTSFWVTQRTRQIGIRRALGARRIDILHYFLVENSLVTLIGLAVGLVLVFVLNRQMIATSNSMTPLPTVFLPIGMISLWVLGLVSVYLPASRAARVDPAIATRS